MCFLCNISLCFNFLLRPSFCLLFLLRLKFRLFISFPPPSSGSPSFPLPFSSTSVSSFFLHLRSRLPPLFLFLFFFISYFISGACIFPPFLSSSPSSLPSRRDVPFTCPLHLAPSRLADPVCSFCLASSHAPSPPPPRQLQPHVLYLMTSLWPRLAPPRPVLPAHYNSAIHTTAPSFLTPPTLPYPLQAPLPSIPRTPPTPTHPSTHAPPHNTPLPCPFQTPIPPILTHRPATTHLPATPAPRSPRQPSRSSVVYCDFFLLLPVCDEEKFSIKIYQKK